MCCKRDIILTACHDWIDSMSLNVRRLKIQIPHGLFMYFSSEKHNALLWSSFLYLEILYMLKDNLKSAGNMDEFQLCVFFFTATATFSMQSLTNKRAKQSQMTLSEAPRPPERQRKVRKVIDPAVKLILERLENDLNPYLRWRGGVGERGPFNLPTGEKDGQRDIY